MSDQFDIVIQSKAKHGILWDLVQKFGSVKALAAELDVTGSVVSSWLNMRYMPKQLYRAHTAKQTRVYLHLVELTGRPIEEIFPGFIRDKLSEIPKSSERRITVDEAAIAANDYKQIEAERQTLPCPSVAVEKKHLSSRMEKVIKTLTEREQELLKLRFGVGDEGGRPLTQEETGLVMGISGSRVHQIEAKAIRKLQQPGRSRELVGFLE